MKTILRVGLTAVLGTMGFGQATFEFQTPACTYAFPTPCGATTDLELVSWNGIVPVAPTTPFAIFGATVAPSNGLGMPCAGTQFLRVQCANPNMLTVPGGGPIPATYVASDVYIPIPAGAGSVSFCWDFYIAEGPNASPFNDAAAIEVVGSCGGTALSTIVYADTFTASSAIVDSTACAVVAYGPAGPALEVSPAGPQTVTSAPIPAGGTYLRVRAANASDNDFPSHLLLDDVMFGFGPPPPVPCTLVFSSPFGAGSILMANTACPAAANLSYFSVVDLSAGVFPAGWFYGVDVTMPELLNEFVFGPPFTGVLDITGASTSPGFGPTPLLSGLTLYGVTTEWLPGFGAFVSSRPAVSYTIP